MNNFELNRQYEDSLIGEVIGLDWAADEAIETGLTPEHFSSVENGAIFVAVMKQREKGLPVNAAEISSVLRFIGLSEEMIVDVGNRLNAARFETKTGTSAGYYATKIIESWRSTQHLLSAERMISEVNHGTNWQEAESQHQARIDGLMRGLTSSVKTFADTVVDLIEEVNGKRAIGLATGFRDLDAATGGLRPGNLVVIGAGTGDGKSAFALCVAVNIGQAGKRVCIVSAEMTSRELHERAASLLSSINPVRVRQQALTHKERERWIEAIHLAANLPLMVIDNNRNLNSLICHIRAIHRREKLSLVIVDYAQLIQSEAGSREREVASVSASLKGLATDLDIPIIVLAQLNKELEKREDKRPKLSDLRESMALAHDANLVLMIHRPETHKSDDRPGEADIIIRKGRSIDKAVIPLTFRKELTRFQDFVAPVEEYSFASDRR